MMGIIDVQRNADRLREFVLDRPGYLPYPAMAAFDRFEKFQQWRIGLETSMRICVDDDVRPVMAWQGRRIALFDLMLNTAARVGSDAVKLAARLHGQCELHAWVDGPDRKWLAEIIASGREAGVFRDVNAITGYAEKFPADDSLDWEGVIALLKWRDDEPVVTSYSVCDSFMSTACAEWEGPPPSRLPKPSWLTSDTWDPANDPEDAEYGRQEAWDQLPTAVKWRVGMRWLRARKGGLQLKPDDWGSFYFGHGLSALDLLAPDYAERLDRALPSVR